MMKRVVFGIGGFACAALAIGAFATAHAQTEGNAPIVLFNDPVVNADAAVNEQAVSRSDDALGFKDGIRASNASKSEQKKFDLLVRGNELSAVFGTLAKSTGLHIIVADDVKGRSAQAIGANLTPDDAIQILCNSNNLSWGKVGKDTYLIVKQQTRVTFTPAYRYVVPQPPGSQAPYNGQPPQADQKNFRLWLLNRNQAQTEK